jgi:hypothetical protein
MLLWFQCICQMLLTFGKSDCPFFGHSCFQKKGFDKIGASDIINAFSWQSKKQRFLF